MDQNATKGSQKGKALEAKKTGMKIAAAKKDIQRPKGHQTGRNFNVDFCECRQDESTLPNQFTPSTGHFL